MRHWVYALVLGILLGAVLGVGETLLWHGASKQALPQSVPRAPAVIVLLGQEDGAQFGDGSLAQVGSELQNHSVNAKLVNGDLLMESVRLRKDDPLHKDEPELTRFRKVSQEFSANLLVVIRYGMSGPNEKQMSKSTLVRIFAVDTGVLLWDKHWFNNEPASAKLVAEAIKNLSQGPGLTHIRSPKSKE